MSYDYSPFGYWISPEGTITNLTEPQSHARVAVLLKGSVEEAIEDGWIAVTFSPKLESCGVRYRYTEQVNELQRGLESKALSSLHLILKDHSFLDHEIRSDNFIGLGKDLISLLRETRMSTHLYHTPDREIAALRNQMKEKDNLLTMYQADLARAKYRDISTTLRIMDSVATGIEADVNRFFEAIKKCSSVKEIVDQAHYWVGHEIGGRRANFIKHLTKDIRKFLTKE